MEMIVEMRTMMWAVSNSYFWRAVSLLAARGRGDGLVNPSRGQCWDLEEHIGQRCGWRWKWRWRWRQRFGLSLIVAFGERYPWLEQGTGG
eukprot:5665808-Karenia_brevis.AAC.1